MKSNIKKILWYLKRPKYYGQFFSKIVRKINLIIFKNNEDISIKWCEQSSITTEEAILQITGKAINQPIRELYPNIFLTQKNYLI